MNPKAWLIALAALAAFTVPGEPMLPQAGIFAALSMPWLLLWAAALGLLIWARFLLAARRVLGDGWRMRAFNLVMAALLILGPTPLSRG